MKNFTRIIVLYMLLLSVAGQMYAQVTIGTGTLTARYPIHFYYQHGRHVAIYTAAEMNTTLAGGTITTLTYTAVSTTYSGSVTIKMLEVGSTTTVSSGASYATVTSGATTVFSGTITPVAGANVVDITDFAVNTNQNLMIIFECNSDPSISCAGQGLSTDNTWNYTASASGSGAYFDYDDSGTAPSCTPGTISTALTLSHRPNVTLGGLTPPAVPLCATLNTPADNATGVVRNTPLTWIAPGSGTPPTSYQVYLGTSSPPSLVTTVTAPTVTYTPTGQAYNTVYYWYIVPVNAGGPASGCNSTIFSYTTEMAPPPPANDECANATAATVNVDGTCAITNAGTITNATASTGAPASACGTYDDDVWFSFVAPTATLNFTLTAGTGITDYTHQIISGACGAQTALVCSDPNTSTYTGFAIGTTYYVRVASWTSTTGQTGNFTLCIATPPPPPANDECAGALSVSVNSGTTCTLFTAGTVAAATASTGAPSSACGTYDDDVWFSFVATSQIHNITLQNVTGSTTDLTHQVLSGACGSLTALVCSDPNTSTVSGLTIGQTYYIRVASWTSTAGQTSVFEVCVSTPPNMAYVSSTTTQQTGTAGAGGVDQSIIRIDVTVINQNSPISITSFNLSTNGTSVPADLTNAKVYYTGTSTTFSTTNLFGSFATPNGAFTINGSQVLTGGTTNTLNYFWLAYDLTCSAAGPNLDGECTSFVINGGSQTPTVTAPALNKTVTALAAYNTAANGNWSSPSTWGCGVPPANTTIPININHNVTLDLSTAIQSTLTIAATKTFDLNGNTFGIGTAGTGTQSLVSNGTVTLNNGTLNVGTATTATTSNITFNTGSTLNAGSGGTINLGPTGGYNRTFSSAGTLNFTGANININGNLLITNGTFNMSAGTVTVDGNGPSSVASSTDLVRFGSTSSAIVLNGTGGTFIIVDPHASSGSTINRAVAVSVSSSNSGATSLQGVTFQLGDGISTTAGNTSGFNFDTYVSTKNIPLGNVIANGGNGATRFISGTGSSGNAADCYTLTVNSGSEVRTIGATTGVGLGVYGNIINDGTITISAATLATLYLGGKQLGSPPAATIAQTISGGGLWRNNVTSSSATASIHNVAMNNTAGTTLQVPLSVGGTLTLTSGKIFTNAANYLAVGTGLLPLGGVATIGTSTISGGSVTSHIVGPIYRTAPLATTWATITDQRGLFPVGDGTNYRPINVAVTTAPSTAGPLSGEHKNTDPGVPASSYTDGGITIETTSPTGFWNVSYATSGISPFNTTAGGVYSVQCNANGFTKRPSGTIAAGDIPSLRLIKRPTGGSFVTGADGAPTAPAALTAITRTGCTTFSDFAVGSTFVVLPLELRSFSGKVLPTSNMIQWVTEAEVNVAEHIIERSATGTSGWTEVGRVAARNAANEQPYELEDRAPMAKSYYRLRSVDTDGREQKSQVIELTRNNKQFGITGVFPNPTSSDVTVQFALPQEGKVTIRVTDLTGRVVLEQAFDANNGINTQLLPLSTLQAGAYTVTVFDAASMSDPVRIIKQ